MKTIFSTSEETDFSAGEQDAQDSQHGMFLRVA